MNFRELIFTSELERRIVEKILAQEAKQVTEELAILAEDCCDEWNKYFSGEVGEV